MPSQMEAVHLRVMNRPSDKARRRQGVRRASGIFAAGKRTPASDRTRHNPTVQLKIGVGRFQAKSATRVWLRGPGAATPANRNFGDRGRLGVWNSAGRFRAHFS